MASTTPQPPLRVRLAPLALMGLLAGSGAAHDFWIEPSSHQVDGIGRLIAVELRVGDGFRGEVFPRDPSHAESFLALTESGGSEVPGEAGASPAGLWRPMEEGTHVLSYRSTRSRIEVEAEAFDRYLAEKGLDEVLIERALSQRDDLPGRELYSRCAKALVVVGEPDRSGHARRVGLPLEIVLEKSPWSLPADEALPVRVLHRGRGLADALLVARRADAPHQAIEARTDEDGLASMDLPGPGRWLLAVVHARRAPPRLPPELSADWESTWSSLTFELPASSSVTNASADNPPLEAR